MYFRIKFLQGAKAGQELTVPGPMIRFGRDASCEVAFDPEQDSQASGTHAQLLFTDQGQILLSDLGSSNGTFLGEQKLKGAQPISSGAVVTFGEGGPQCEISLVPRAAPQAAPAPPPSAPPTKKGGKGKWIALALILIVVIVVVIAVAASGD